MRDMSEAILDILNRNLQRIWDGDEEIYRATTANDVSFFEWYISPQRIDGLGFQLRELSIHKDVVGGAGSRVDDILLPRVQV